ncbi:MAG: heavy-metal-associated domain-containing protein [Parvularculaceae bacterium]
MTLRTLIFSLAIAAGPAIATGDPHGNDHGGHSNHNHEAATAPSAMPLTRTDEIDRALAAGGAPIVADVLGVVCDFCAKAMNKTFGERDDVAAVYVDLDNKTLNLVITEGATLSDAEIERLVRKAGYRLSAIRRGAAAVAGGSA